MTVFPDTNICLHYPPLKDIDWLKVCGAPAVRLVFCLQVIEELDQKKAEAQWADRAGRAIREIQQAEAEDPEIRPGVSIRIFNESLRPEDFTGPTSPLSGDDRIARFVLKYKSEHPKESVVVATVDLGMRLRCKAHNIDVITLEGYERVTLPSDDLTKKFRQAQAEVAQLKSRLPSIALAMSSMDAIAPDEQFAAELDPANKLLRDVHAELNALQERYPFSAPLPRTTGRMNYVPSEECDRYNRELNRFFDESRKALEKANEHADAISRTARCQLWLLNGGGAPAEEVQITIFLPTFLSWAGINKPSKMLQWRMNPPSPPMPQPPKPPRTLFEMRTDDFRPEMWQEALRPLPNIRQPNVEVSATGNETEGFKFHAEVLNLRHLHRVSLGPAAFTFQRWENIAPIELRFEATATNHPKQMSGRILLPVALAKNATFAAEKRNS